MVLTGCSTGGQSTTQSPNSDNTTSESTAAEPVKDTVVHVEKADLVTLDPTDTSDRKPAFYQIYNTLVREDFNDTSKIVPCLAESWKISDDGT